MKKVLVRFGLILAGTVFSLIIVEIALRVTGLPIGFGSDALTGDNRIGWIYAPNQRKSVCRDLLKDCVRIRTNNQALREDDPSKFEKLPGTKRVLVLGDSQTAADLVENYQTYSNVLEKLLNENNASESYEVLNGGVPGYSPVQEWLWFRELGIQYQPDLTLLGFYVGNDLFELRESPGRPYFELTLDDEIVLKNFPVQSNTGPPNPREEVGAINFLKRLLSPSYVYQMVRYVAKSSALEEPLRDIGLMQTEPSDPVSQAISHCYGCVFQSLTQSYNITPAEEDVRFLLLEETLKRLRGDTAKTHSRLIILLIPTKLQIEPELEPDLIQSAQILDLKIDDAIENDQRIHDRAMELSLKLGIEVIDALPALHEYHQQHEEPLFFDKDWHLTPVGHRVLAMEIYQYLIDHQTLD